MGSFTITIDIDSPLDDVFAFIGEPRWMPLWYAAVETVSSTSSDGPRPGARFVMTRSLPGGQARNVVEVSEYVPGSRVTLESLEGPTPFRYQYDLEPSRCGTLLTLNGDISSSGLPGIAEHVDGLATQLFKRGMRKNLDVLKRLAEMRSPARYEPA